MARRYLEYGMMLYNDMQCVQRARMKDEDRFSSFEIRSVFGGSEALKEMKGGDTRLYIYVDKLSPLFWEEMDFQCQRSKKINKQELPNNIK